MTLVTVFDVPFPSVLEDTSKSVNSDLTIYKLKQKINSIIPFEPQKYDTCKNSCIAFTSSYENLIICPICGENRFEENGKPINTTFFFSLKERLIIQYKDKERAEELQYRNTYLQNKEGENNGTYADVFDGIDIALSGSCDGYQIFEQKTDDCWVIILINNNLPPHVRNLKELEEGVPCIDGRTDEPFTLRAHLLTWTGDIPALSKSLNLCGHNRTPLTSNRGHPQA
ncbi:hypothetical protein RhiirA4_482389 [Rhizophagus irregularis]|uniref:Transposase domain-containing protein n=1 Tax=Rhizophagus irregularis TaxID=588596 RepID=A0A2I1HL07_9GLOM|nr:hypothetical protein RhiirA4_482389 [Rhizophagus irregularis]